MDLPTFKLLLIDVARFVERTCINEVGVYRIPGNTSVAQDLFNRYVAREAVDLGAFCTDPLTATTLLKYALRHLRDPLILRLHYPILKCLLLLKESTNATPKRGIEAMFQQLFSREKREILYLLAAHFRKVSNCKPNNMSLVNLVTVFGPTCIEAYNESPLEEMRVGPAMLKMILDNIDSAARV